MFYEKWKDSRIGPTSSFRVRRYVMKMSKKWKNVVGSRVRKIKINKIDEISRPVKLK